MHHPKVLFLDEPTLGLDPQTREHIWTYIEKLAREEKMSIIITTHYMDEAEKLCDRIAIIDNGKIVVLDTPDNLKKIIGGDVVTLTLKTGSPNVDALKKFDFVKKVERQDHIVKLTVTEASRHLPEILNEIGESQIESVEVHTPTLNDVFLHYTGKEIREDSPEGGWAERMMHARTNR
jgi:ABC-2 type transport system ATP-binding protein